MKKNHTRLSFRTMGVFSMCFICFQKMYRTKFKEQNPLPPSLK